MCQVKTAQIFNQHAIFCSWWVGGGLEYFQPVNGGLVEIFILNLPNPIGTQS